MRINAICAGILAYAYDTWPQPTTPADADTARQIGTGRPQRCQAMPRYAHERTDTAGTNSPMLALLFVA